MKSIDIVGAGTAGLVSALIAHTRWPHVRIRVIASSQIGIIGVGEGSTEHWTRFLTYIGVSWQECVRATGATLKTGILFDHWGVAPYMHSNSQDLDLRNGDQLALYQRIIGLNLAKDQINPPGVWASRVLKWYQDQGTTPTNQYHFDTMKLNQWLQRLCLARGIDLIDDLVTDVDLAEGGGISQVRTATSQYTADFYIDSTGFRRLLIDALGAEWQSYSRWLKMKEAIVFPLPYTSEELPMYTRSRAMTAGWMFTIPVQTRTGNGYIYDSDYITREQAQAEVEQVLGHPVEVARHIRFDPGCVDRPWIDNCCAVGLSASFVEPLEATSIGTTIQQMFLLINRLPDATPASQARYNQSVQDIMTNIRDFVLAHYITPRRDTEFWLAQSRVQLPAGLARQLDYWRTNLPQAEDFAGVSPYVLFKEANWTQVLWGLDHFDQAAIQTHYEMNSEQVRAWVEDTYRFIHPEGPDDRAYVTHRQFIDRVCGSSTK